MLQADFSLIHLLTIGTGEFRKGYTRQFMDRLYPYSPAAVKSVLTMLFFQCKKDFQTRLLTKYFTMTI